MSRELKGDEYADLATCLSANAARFAAHKAVYVEGKINEILSDDKLTEQQRIDKANAAMNTFHRWGITEGRYIAQTSQMAAKWADFEKDGDKYYLQYRTAADEKVRDEHAALHNTTLPPSDPFWNEFYPPIGWNCRCNVVQVNKDKYKQSDSSKAINTGMKATQKAPSFRFNAGKEKKLFSDNVSYFKHAGKNVQERKNTEKQCELLNKKHTIAENKQLLYKNTTCTINGVTELVRFTKRGIEEYTQSLFGQKHFFWLKNELLQNISKHITHAEYKGYKSVDLSHNTNSKRLKFKAKLDCYIYFETKMPDGSTACIQMTRDKRTKEISLYTITKNVPSDIIKGKLP